MKTILRTILLLFLYASNVNAQTSVQNFDDLKKTVNGINPNVDFNNKIIFVSIWKSTDFESREVNKEAYRVYKIYEHAKLKNGEKGTVFISLNLDTDEQNRVFASTKDGIDASFVYTEDNLKKTIYSAFNGSNTQSIMVLDKTGTIQYTNIPKDQIFNSLRALITR